MLKMDQKLVHEQTIHVNYQVNTPHSAYLKDSKYLKKFGKKTGFIYCTRMSALQPKTRDMYLG